MAAAWSPSPSTVSTSSGTRRQTRQQQVAGAPVRAAIGKAGSRGRASARRRRRRRGRPPGGRPPADRRAARRDHHLQPLVEPVQPDRRGIGRTSPSTCSTSTVCTTASWTCRRSTNATSCRGAQVQTRSAGCGAGQRRLQLRAARPASQPSSSSSGAPAARGSRPGPWRGCGRPSAQKCCTSARCHTRSARCQSGQPGTRAPPAVRQHRLGRGVVEPRVRPAAAPAGTPRAPSVLLRRRARPSARL